MSEYEYPMTEGDLDYQAMVEDLGLSELPPRASVFICDNTGEPRQIVAIDIEVGTARIRDPFVGDEWSVDIADLWVDWRYDDLHFVNRAFLHDTEVVVDRISLATLADLANEMLEEQSMVGEFSKELDVAVGEVYEALGHAPSREHSR